MRPYRGKTKDGKWVKGWYFHCSTSDTHNIHILDDSTWPIVTEVIPETVGQSTGLKDKKGTGNEVFEGDKITRGDGMIYAVISRKLKGQWWLRDYVDGMLRGWSVPLMQAAEEYIVVIGTIHDNPEIVNNKS